MTGTDEQTDAVIKAGALPILGKLLQHSRMNLVKEASHKHMVYDQGLEIAVMGLVFFAPKVAFSWPSVYRFCKKIWGLMILGQVKSIQNFC